MTATTSVISLHLGFSFLEEIEDAKKEKMNSSALNKINCDRKLLIITTHFILCMRESIKQNI